MSKKLRDLKPSSIATLQPYIAFWSSGDANKPLESRDLERSLDDKFEIHTTTVIPGHYIADYALTYAVLLDDKELTQHLCSLGINVNVHDDCHNKKSPLEIAIDYGRAGIVDILLKNGAQLPRDITVQSNNPCCHPLSFFWKLNELAHSREVDYQTISSLVYGNRKSD